MTISAELGNAGYLYFKGTDTITAKNLRNVYNYYGGTIDFQTATSWVEDGGSPDQGFYNYGEVLRDTNTGYAFIKNMLFYNDTKNDSTSVGGVLDIERGGLYVRGTDTLGAMKHFSDYYSVYQQNSGNVVNSHAAIDLNSGTNTTLFADNGVYVKDGWVYVTGGLGDTSVCRRSLAAAKCTFRMPRWTWATATTRLAT